MCNKNDGKWLGVKKQISKKYNEITDIWYVGVDHRNNCLDKGINGWNDPECTTDNLGILSGQRKNIIDEILNTNRMKVSNNEDCVNPKELPDDSFKSWLNDNYGNYFVDFEAINDVLYTNPNNINIENSKTDSTITFMIGLGFDKRSEIDTKYILSKLIKNDCGIYYKSNDKWEYICFYINKYDIEQEKNMFKNFMNFILERYNLIKLIKGKSFNISNNLYHWTPAELVFMNTSMVRHINNDNLIEEIYDNFYKNCSWLDLYKLFTTVPITIKGCFNFKLKSVTNALYSLGIINTVWPDTGISEGMTAMLKSIKVYKTIKNKDLVEDETFKLVIDYNEIDCKAVWDILLFLRKKYINL